MLTIRRARYIAPRDAELFGDLALGEGGGKAEAVAQADDLAFTRGQAMGKGLIHGVVPVVIVHGAKVFVLAADHVHQGKSVALAVGVERVGERKLARAFALLAKMHEQFVLDAFRGIGSQLDVFIRPEGAHRLDQPDRADRDQIVLLGFVGVILLYNMGHQPQIVLDQSGAGVLVALLVHAAEQVLFFFGRKRFGKRTVRALHTQDKKEKCARKREQGRPKHGGAPHFVVLR